MTVYVRGFVIPDVADVHALYRDAIKLAQEVVALERENGELHGVGRKQLDALKGSYDDFQLGLKRAAEKASLEAVAGMRARLKATQLRPDTPEVPHLRDLLVARPLNLGLATGAVGVADVAVLDRAINPLTPGYGTYWRAQEYGTGADGVPSQVGRVIFGTFEGGGEATPPDAQYTGGGGGPHAVFRPGGANPGFGTISADIRGRHFIKAGADEAAIAWRENIAKVQTDAVGTLDDAFG